MTFDITVISNMYARPSFRESMGWKWEWEWENMGKIDGAQPTDLSFFIPLSRMIYDLLVLYTKKDPEPK